MSFSSHTGSPRPQDTEIEEGPSGVKSTVCPVCEEAIHGSGEELNAHVEACLRRVRGLSSNVEPLWPIFRQIWYFRSVCQYQHIISVSVDVSV